MTVLEYLRKRAIRAKFIGWGCSVLILVGVFSLAGPTPNVGPYGLYAVGLFAGLAALIFVLQQQLVRCPRCNGGLIRLFTQISFGDAKACPHCHVNFDESYKP